MKSEEAGALLIARKLVKARRSPRGVTISALRLTTAEVEAGKEIVSDAWELKPRTRGECAGVVRPCPFVSCKYNLYLDVNPETGSIKLNFPLIAVDEMVESCALDVADYGGVTLEEIGLIVNLTREGIRQVEVRGLLQLKDVLDDADSVVAKKLLDLSDVHQGGR